MPTAVGAERLRQERETFEQNKEHDARWFRLRLCLGYAAIVLLALIAVVTSWIVLHPTHYPAVVTGAAATALFVDVIGILAGVWKVVLKPTSLVRLRPMTKDEQLPAKR